MALTGWAAIASGQEIPCRDAVHVTRGVIKKILNALTVNTALL